MSRTNYIFVDYENVQETDLDRVANKPIKVTFVLGERNKKLPVTLARNLLKYAGQVTLVETGRSGRNALDLVLAHYVGEARNADPQGYFHIVSEDKDFDALIGHLKDQGALAARHVTFSEIPVLMNPTERLKLLANHFKVNRTGRPKKRKTLGSQIQAIFGNTLSPEEVEETIHGLVTEKIITFSGTGDVTYKN
jgi:PIN domain